MMTTYHNSFGRRVAFTLLAAICAFGVFGLWASPILADPDEVACHCLIDFRGEPLEICVGETAYFQGWPNTYCEISSWTWDFGDPLSGANNIGSGQQTQHTYNMDGVYTVKLTGVDITGDIVITKLDYVTVSAGPTADFSATPLSGYAPLTVSFTDLSTSTMGIFRWTWDFGDGSGSSDQNPTHTYTAAGDYTVILEVEDRCGPDSEVKEVYIHVEDPCKVDFTGVPREICEGETVDFTGTVEGECDISAWSWNFGDGGTGSGQYPSHTYNTAGVYTVILTATDVTGDKIVTKTDYITVFAGPTAAFDANPTAGSAPLTVSFTNHSISPTGGPVYTWYFGDGTYSGDTNPTHTYTSSGVYQVILEVQDRCGIDGEIDTIRVDPICTVDFEGDREICEGETADFEADWFGECNIAALDWDFGDPASGADNTASGQYTSHQYDAAGVYTVTLTANVNGVDTVITKTDYVTVNAGPTADFSATPLSGFAPLTVSFTDLSTSTMGIGLYTWHFGDGDISGDRNPTHTYTAAGDYTVILEVQDACGIDSEIKEVYIHVEDPCKVDFTGVPREICEGETVDFTGTVEGECDISAWNWDFGDGGTGSGQYPQHTYDVAGVYTVILTATDVSGDKVVTKTDYITVNAGPTADFHGLPQAGLAPLTVDFYDHSTSILGITSWTWDFGDGQGSTDQNPLHTYTDTGTYTVSLTVLDPCGESTEIKEAYVFVTECNIDFYGEPADICVGETAYFSGTSTGTCVIRSWTWDFGDPASGANNTGSGQQAQHTYNAAGVYTVTLTAANILGDIVVTKVDYVTVNPGPTADFSATPLAGRAPLTVDFIDLLRRLPVVRR